MGKKFLLQPLVIHIESINNIDSLFNHLVLLPEATVDSGAELVHAKTLEKFVNVEFWER